MTGETKAILGVGLGLFGVGGLLYFGTRSASAKTSSTSSSSSSTSPAPPTGAAKWVRASVIHPGDSLRVSVLSADVAQYGAAMASLLQQGSQDPQVLALYAAYQAMLKAWAPQAPSAQAGALLLFTVGPYGAAFSPAQGGSVLVPAAGDVLPPDWPSDDPNPAGEVHGVFTYAGAAPINVSSLPIPTLVWVQQS